jgi:hypothetical protein
LLADGARHVALYGAGFGAPHAVVHARRVHASSELTHLSGAAIRHHPDFPQGINVNFVEVLDGQYAWQRTFERGVEGETLAARVRWRPVSSAPCSKGGYPSACASWGELSVSLTRGRGLRRVALAAAHGLSPKVFCIPKHGRRALKQKATCGGLLRWGANHSERDPARGTGLERSAVPSFVFPGVRSIARRPRRAAWRSGADRARIA